MPPAALEAGLEDEGDGDEGVIIGIGDARADDGGLRGCNGGLRLALASSYLADSLSADARENNLMALKFKASRS